jgi:signal transduction histidine kinase
VLRSRLGDYTVYYEVLHRHRGPGRAHVTGFALCALLCLLLGCYLILRRMLRPVQDIKQGVVRMGSGELDYRVPIRANNDLGTLARSINTMAADIEQMLDAKRQLLLGASHELRTPITRAKVAVQMLPESSNRDRIAGDLEEMSSLIGEILESERIKGGHSVLDRSEVDLPALLDSVLEDMHHPPVDVSIDPALSALPGLQLDETRMRLLLRNLLGNALTHGATMSDGSAAANPSVTVQARGKANVIIIVRDHGPGIGAEHLEHLTEPFYRADPSRARNTGGFGLGLHLCLLIARAHGGDLAIESNPGAGTTVTVTLPIDAR